MKVLIVDDEKHVRDAIRLLGDWKSFGVDTVLEADNGASAIHIIQQETPQIVVTDMNMPGLGGEQLLEWINEHQSNTKVLVVSGYDDFRLVRHAIRFGGMDYILKPVDPDEINAALSKAIQSWHHEEAKRLDSTRQSIVVNQMRPHYMDQLLSGLISSTGRAHAALSRLRDELLLPHDITHCAVAVISTSHLDPELLGKYEHNHSLLQFSILNVCSEFLESRRTGTAFRNLKQADEIVLLYWRDSAMLPQILNDMNQGMSITLGRYVHFGVSSASPFPQGLYAAYHEARQALWRRNLLQASGCLHHAAPPASASRSLRMSAWEEKLRVSALSCNDRQIAAAVGEWLAVVSLLDSIHAEQIAGWNSELDWMLGRWLDDRPEDAAGEELSGQREAATALPMNDHGLLDISLWRQQMEKRLKAAGTALTQIHGKENHIIRDIARYLDQHYAEEISLQDMAGRFYLSREYISRKFKQEFGMNLTDYLGRVRIRQAKLLLLNPQLRVTQIAEMVGYQDEKYFSKVFKKMEGRSPAEFRKQAMPAKS
ncbi:response regulator [Paenibacillus sp. JX-17]|uniref:Response regulator n=1 Tax=Paenibacillus lacisoli TaxID=3064525 RepID=A0ABT9CBP2_9BACL|nr:response regulator [Paenibacillus sp. JX-17]MDO7906675.1 response regulator [Paenibacillus sp. JX-17]